MDIVLEQELEAFVQLKIQDGAYRDMTDAIHAALRLLREREEKVQALKDAIAVGVAQADAGLCVPLTEELVEQILERGRQRHLARKGQP